MFLKHITFLLYSYYFSCTAIICPFEEGVNSHPLMNKTYYYNETVEYVCNEGFKVESGLSVLVCGFDESWNGLPLNCSGIFLLFQFEFPSIFLLSASFFCICHFAYFVAIECEIVNVENAQILTTNLTTMMPFESTIVYECQSGFILSSGDYINTCSGTGNWTNLPTCSCEFKILI